MSGYSVEIACVHDDGRSRLKPIIVHEISKRDVIDIFTTIERREAPVAANKALKAIKMFLRWWTAHGAVLALTGQRREDVTAP